jgi:hypothetical protein
LSVSVCFSPTAMLLRNFPKVVTCSKFTVLVSHVCLSFPYIFLDVYIGMRANFPHVFYIHRVEIDALCGDALGNFSRMLFLDVSVFLLIDC